VKGRPRKTAAEEVSCHFITQYTARVPTLLSPVVPRAFLNSLSAQSVVGFAGSRSFSPCPSFCLSLLCQLASSRCRFALSVRSWVARLSALLACAPGVDRAFHFPLVFHFSGSASFYRAFPERSSLGLPVAWSSPAGLRPAVALATRTRQLVTACTHLVLVPHRWGPGSRLCYRLCRERGVMVLVVA